MYEDYDPARDRGRERERGTHYSDDEDDNEGGTDEIALTTHDVRDSLFSCARLSLSTR